MASRESIKKKLSRTRERIEELSILEKELEEQYQDAERSESLRLLKKYGISSEELERRLLLSVMEVNRLFAEKGRLERIQEQEKQVQREEIKREEIKKEEQLRESEEGQEKQEQRNLKNKERTV